MHHENIKVGRGLSELYRRLSRRRRREFAAIIALMLVAAVAELATISAVIPFLTLLSQQGSAAQLPGLSGLLDGLGLAGASTSVTAMAVLFAACAAIAGAVRLGLAWLTQDFVYRIGHEFALDAQRRILSQPYAFHIERHSSTLITATDKVEVLVFDLVLPIMQMLAAAVIGTMLVAALLYVAPLATAIAVVAFIIIYAPISLIVGKRLRENSSVIATAYHERLKVEQESLGGIRDVIIDKSENLHLDLFDRVNGRLARARATTNFMAQAPRFLVESAGTIIIAAVALFLSGDKGGIIAALPFLGALALGAQRLLPLVHSLYTGWSLATAHRSIIGQVLEILRLPLAPPAHNAAAATAPLSRSIRFSGVSFSYPSRPDMVTIDKVSFEIAHGSMVAILGETGSGKTTLADLMMGLVQPTSGEIWIDDLQLTAANARDWQASIAHVSQSVFLADATIAENVALSRPHQRVDAKRVAEALEAAQLNQFAASLPDGVDTVVGERGVRLSGGQRQRLGLARAVYKRAPFFVLDEATSALDESNEAAVIASLDRLRHDGRTIAIIAHRRSTISRCDAVIRLHAGRIIEAGPMTGASAAQRS